MNDTDPDSLAVNGLGIAYKHGIQDRKKFAVLAIRSCTSKNLTEENLKLPKANPLSISKEEETLTSNPSKTQTVLWVGMFLSNLRELAGGESNKQSVLSLSRGQSFVTGYRGRFLDTQPQAIRVGVLLSSKTLRYLALYNDVEGLSDGAKVSQAEVFFFSEFRDDSQTSATARTQYIASVITNFCTQRSPQNSRAEEGVQAKVSSTTTTVAIHWQKDIKNSVRSLISSYELDPQPWLLNELKRTVEEIDADMLRSPEHRFRAIYRLFTPGQIFDIEHAIEAMDEILVLYNVAFFIILTNEGSGSLAGVVTVGYQSRRDFDYRQGVTIDGLGY